MNKERIQANKNPFFYKKSAIAKMLMASKLDSLGSKEKLTKYMNKKKRAHEGRKMDSVKLMQTRKMQKLQRLQKSEGQ